MKRKLNNIFLRLSAAFGPQHWWPAENAFEVIVGAILTQNTNWQNVEKALLRLKEQKLLTPKKLAKVRVEKLASLIKSAGYYNLKAARLKFFLRYFLRNYGGSIRRMARRDLADLRQELLGVKGIGPETADSILLYALAKPVFVIDAYTKRIFSRHKLAKEDADYSWLQQLFTRNLKHDVSLFNEYHALLVKLGKDFCRKKNPKCEICPLYGQ